MRAQRTTKSRKVFVIDASTSKPSASSAAAATGTQFFGVKLTDLMQRQRAQGGAEADKTTPTFFRSLCGAIVDRGLEEEGIFRVNASKTQVLELVDSINQQQNPTADSLPIPCVCALLKLFWREMPERLFVEGSLDKLLRDGKVTPHLAQQVAASLHVDHREMLKEIVHLFHKITEKSDINKMTIENLNICIAPNVAPRGATENPLTAFRVLELTGSLLSHYCRNPADIDTPAQATSTTAEEVTEDSANAMTDMDAVILWVDHNTDIQQGFFEFLNLRTTKDLLLLQLQSLSDLKQCLDQHKEAAAKLLVSGRLLIVTNRYRPEDGEDKAGELLVQWLKAEKNAWNRAQVLVFCGNESSVAHLHDPGSGTHVTSDAGYACQFMCNELPKWSRNETPKADEAQPAQQPVKITSQQVVLWVDPNHNSAEAKALLGMVSHTNPQVVVVGLNSMQELTQYFDKYSEMELTRAVSKHNIRVVTNRYRENDGGANAGSLTIKQVKNGQQKKITKSIPVMLYCGDRSAVKKLHDKKKGVFVVDSSTVAVDFMAFKKL